jgi:hypothetical protein
LAEGTDDRIRNGGDSDGAKSHIGAAGNGQKTGREPRQRGTKELSKLSGGGVPFTVDEGGTEYGGCQTAVTDNFLGSPFCLVVVGGGVGTGAESADVKEARDGGCTGGGYDMGGSLKMNTGKGLRVVFSDNPDGVDDRLGVLEGVAKGVGLGDVGGEKFHVGGEIGGGGPGEGSHG